MLHPDQLAYSRIPEHAKEFHQHVKLALTLLQLHERFACDKLVE